MTKKEKINNNIISEIQMKVENISRQYLETELT